MMLLDAGGAPQGASCHLLGDRALVGPFEPHPHLSLYIRSVTCALVAPGVFMNRLIVPVLAAVLLCACASDRFTRRCDTQPEATKGAVVALEAPAQASSSTVDDLFRLMTGRFDNHLQVLDDEAAKSSHPHQRIHSIFTPIEAPQVGTHLLYVEQYSDEDRTKVYRKRLYRFVAENPEVVRLEIASFVDAQRTEGVLTEPGRLSALQDAELDWKEGCEVRWRRVDDHFEGSTTRGACRVPSRHGGTLLIEDDLRLDAQALWIQDRAFDEEGKRVFGHPDGVPHKLQRAASFKGWAALKDPKDPTRWIRAQSLQLHDQGDEVALLAEDGSPLPYVVRLAQRVYRKSGTAILKMTVRARGSEAFLTYTWTAPDAQRIGVNLGDFQSGLTRVVPKAPEAKLSAAATP